MFFISQTVKHKPCRMSCQQFFNDSIYILVAAKLNHSRKLQETHV